MGDLADWFTANRETKTIERFGTTWEVPAEMPASLWLWARDRFWDQGRPFEQATIADFDDAIELIDGLEGHVKEWISAGASARQVYVAVRSVVLGYLADGLGGGGASGEAEGSTSDGSSPDTSDSSQPTGAESTAPTSEQNSEEG